MSHKSTHQKRIKKNDNETAVLLIDFQADFIKHYKGSLAVPQTDESYINSIHKACIDLEKLGYPIYASQDWHPFDHISFASNHRDKACFETILIENKEQILWPNHCVKNTSGAQIMLPSDLNFTSIKKGMCSKYESYSVFADDPRRKYKFTQELKKKGIKNLLIFGLALDFCVKETIVDAVKLGFKVTLIKDLCKGVNPILCEELLIQFDKLGVKIYKNIKELENFDLQC